MSRLSEVEQERDLWRELALSTFGYAPQPDARDPLTVVLKDAYHRIDDKRHWTQGALCRDRNGRSGQSRAEQREAASWCALGAVLWATDRRMEGGTVQPWLVCELLAERVLRQALDGEDVSTVNDGPDGYRKIRAAFRKAIRARGGTV